MYARPPENNRYATRRNSLRVFRGRVVIVVLVDDVVARETASRKIVVRLTSEYHVVVASRIFTRRSPKSDVDSPAVSGRNVYTHNKRTRSASAMRRNRTCVIRLDSHTVNILIRSGFAAAIDPG